MTLHQMKAATMKFSIALLADGPGVKTVCILATPAPESAIARKSTQIRRLFTHSPITKTDLMVTVVVKGTALPSRLIEQLVSDFFTKHIDNKEWYTLEIDDLYLTAPQASKSNMNSSAISKPPSIM